jgi:putative peptidoglycan lipid II flippase
MLVMVPATAGLIVLAAPIVQLVFERDKFTPFSTIVTAKALCFYAPGLIVFSLYKILTPVFYAMEDTRTPVKIGIAAVALNLFLNIAFILTWPTGYRHAGLACATVIASAFNCIALAVIITRRIGSPGWKTIAISFIRTAVSAALMMVAVALAHKLLPELSGIFSSATKAGQLMNVALSIAAGLLVYAVAALTICRRDCDIIRHR